MNNITLKLIENYGISVLINENSDIIVAFNYLKLLTKLDEKIPTSIYTIKVDEKGCATKHKKSLNFFKRMTIDEFIDAWDSLEGTIVHRSGDVESTQVDGWEIRYALKIDDKWFEGVKGMVEKSATDEIYD